MSKPIQISIPQPCHENWAAMTPSDKGRFCASCQKNVIDFTRSSDREIAQAFKQQGNLCGKFRNDQLQRDLVVPKEKSSLWAAASAAILAFLSFGSTEVKAQSHPTEKIDAAGRKKVSAINPRPMVNGNVIIGNGKSSKATVTNKNTLAQTTTDENGSFIISLAEGDILEFTCEGFENQTIIYNKKDNIKVYMTPIQQIICTVGGATTGIKIEDQTTTIPENRATRSIWDLFN